MDRLYLIAYNMINNNNIRGLYAITDNNLIKAEEFTPKVEQAIIGGVKIIQYRDKSKNYQLRFEQAQALSQLCHKYQIPLIINDDVVLAQQVGADGVHLGKDDADIASARAVLGEQAIIGVSCYNQLSLALDAVKAGTNYVAFGRFFNSATKPNAIGCSVEILRDARQRLNCPLVAIGGITPDNGKELIKAGADCLAVIHGLFGQADVTAAAQEYAKISAVQAVRNQALALVGE
jgi:thiamine-phosphate pyrophosphorylase